MVVKSPDNQVNINVIQLMNEAKYLMKNLAIEESVIRRGRRARRITPSEISIILHMIRNPNSIIVLLSIQNNS